jgi:NADPH-dependent ferric siderophore reductase
MWEIGLRGPAFGMVNARPGAHVPVEVPLENGGAVLRTYSVWAHDRATASLTLRVVDHRPGGPGSRWAARASVGQRLRIGLPRNRIALDPAAPYHVFVGDETAAAPLLSMLAALPRDATAFGVLETVDPANELSIPDGRAVSWVHRGAASAVNSPVLLRAVGRLELPARPGVAYVAGESATCRAVARYLVQTRGWHRRAVRTQVHWTPGKSGLL